MNIKMKSLSLAVAAATATMGSMAASAASFDRGNPEVCYNDYAVQTLQSQVFPGSPVRYPPSIHDDIDGLEGLYEPSESMLSIDGAIGLGLSGADNFYIRIDLTNATFNQQVTDDDVYIQRGEVAIFDGTTIHDGGAVGDDYVIVSFFPKLETHAEDKFYIDLDTLQNAGLQVGAIGSDVDVQYRLYENSQDALFADEPDHFTWPLVEKNQCLASTDNDGIDKHVMSAVHDPIASVKCKGGFSSFSMNGKRDRLIHENSPSRPYSCFISKGLQNFGGFEIQTDYLDANDGMRSIPADYMNLAYSTMTLGDELGWVDTDQAFAVSNDRAFEYCGHRYDEPQEVLASGGNFVPWYFPEDGVRDTAHLYVGALKPYITNPQDPRYNIGESKWNVCLDDWRGDYRYADEDWNWHYKYPTIPLKDNLWTQLTIGDYDFDAGQGYRRPVLDNPADDDQDTFGRMNINGIDRNGMVLRLPILLDADNHKIVLTNRGIEDAEYRLLVTTDPGNPYELGSKSQGVIPQGSTIVVKVKDMVDFGDNEAGSKDRGAGIIVVAGLPELIDAAEVLTGDSGDKGVINVTTDEGYNGGYKQIIDSEDD